MLKWTMTRTSHTHLFTLDNYPTIRFCITFALEIVSLSRQQESISSLLNIAKYRSTIKVRYLGLILTLEDETDSLSRNVGNELPLHTA